MNKTNIEILTDFMNLGSPLNQIFVMDAVNKLANLVISNKARLRVDMKDGFVDPEAWIDTALNWKSLYDANYK